MSGERRLADRSHGIDRHYYTCYQRRTAKACDQPYLSQERLEAELFGVLQAIALPEGVAEAVDAAVAELQGSQGRTSRQVSLKTLEERQRRLNEMYELGRVQREEYVRRSAELDAEGFSLYKTGVVSVLPRGHGSRFLAVVERVGFHRFPLGFPCSAEWKGASFQMIRATEWHSRYWGLLPTAALGDGNVREARCRGDEVTESQVDR